MRNIFLMKSYRCSVCTLTACYPTVSYSINLGMPSNLNADNSKMSNMTGLASRALLSLPFIGAEIRLWGVESVNAKNIKRLMTEKKSIGLLPGGFE